MFHFDPYLSWRINQTGAEKPSASVMTGRWENIWADPPERTHRWWHEPQLGTANNKNNRIYTVLRQVNLDATFFFFSELWTALTSIKSFPPALLHFLPLLSPPPDSPPLSLPCPACLQPSSMLSVPWPTVWSLWLFMCEVRAGWHCASVCGQAVFTSVWPWSLEPGTWSCPPVHPGHHPEDCSRTWGRTYSGSYCARLPDE